jgi:hypothetical protein
MIVLALNHIESIMKAIIIILYMTMILISHGSSDVSCEDDYICIALFAPVCAYKKYDYRAPYLTFNNTCELSIYQDCVDHEYEMFWAGSCDEYSCPRNFTFSYSYDGASTVCGSNDKTYMSEKLVSELNDNCDMSLTVSSRGECPRCQESLCPDDFPICGTDNTTYGSKESFDRASITNPDLQLLYEGLCLNCSEPQATPAVYDPVCGSNGITYSNEALLGLAMRCDDYSIRLAFRGDCSFASAIRIPQSWAMWLSCMLTVILIFLS